jgi:iron complex transport system ATP-binding protein
MTVLVGANGCGKSTLLSTIARLLKPLGGSGSWTAKRFTTADQSGRASWGSCRSAAVPEGLTVFELVSAGAFPGKLYAPVVDDDELAVEEALR